MERADKPTGEDHCGKTATGARVPYKLNGLPIDHCLKS